MGGAYVFIYTFVHVCVCVCVWGGEVKPKPSPAASTTNHTWGPMQLALTNRLCADQASVSQFKLARTSSYHRRPAFFFLFFRRFGGVGMVGYWFMR